MLRTYADLIDHVSRIVMGHGLAANREQVKTAIGAAYAALPLQAPWKRYQTTYRFTIQEPETYTVQAASDGVTVTIASGSWPDWLTAGGSVRIGGALCEIGDIPTSRRVILSRGLSGAQTNASATFYNDLHQLPEDFVNTRSAFLVSPPCELRPIQRDDAWRYSGVWQISGAPAFYTIEKGLTDRIRFLPPPGGNYQVDFVYHRSPTPLVYTGHNVKDSGGLVTISGRNVTGNNTSFASAMKDCVIRVSASAAEVPTGPEGYNPYAEQRIISSVSSSTALTVSEAFDSAYANVRYSITDILDVDEHLYQLLIALATMEMVKMLGAKIPVDILSPLRAALAADASQTANTSRRFAPAAPFIHGRLILTQE